MKDEFRICNTGVEIKKWATVITISFKFNLPKFQVIVSMLKDQED